MANTSAATEPSTLAAAFNDHAQRTEELCHFSSRARPIGKGIPMRNPAGKISATVTAIFHGSGKVMPLGSNTATSSARNPIRIATPASTALHRAAEAPMTARLEKLPTPLETRRKDHHCQRVRWMPEKQYELLD